jgi:hypothetical protein
MEDSRVGFFCGGRGQWCEVEFHKYLLSGCYRLDNCSRYQNKTRSPALMEFIVYHLLHFTCILPMTLSKSPHFSVSVIRFLVGGNKQAQTKIPCLWHYRWRIRF